MKRFVCLVFVLCVSLVGIPGLFAGPGEPPKEVPPAVEEARAHQSLPALPGATEEAPAFHPAEITQGKEEPKKTQEHFGKVERSLGLGYFRKSGYQTFLEPRISFVKRKADHSETVEYSWRPMLPNHMPHKERIDLIRFSCNRYFFAGSDRKIFYGAGLGGNVVLFSDKMKNWTRDHKFTVKDGVNGLGRIFFGYKFSEVEFMGTKYPIVFRVDAFISPPYRFGGNIGTVGDKLKLTEVTAGISFSIE